MLDEPKAQVIAAIIGGVAAIASAAVSFISATRAEQSAAILESSKFRIGMPEDRCATNKFPCQFQVRSDGFVVVFASAVRGEKPSLDSRALVYTGDHEDSLTLAGEASASHRKETVLAPGNTLTIPVSLGMYVRVDRESEGKVKVKYYPVEISMGKAKGGG